MMTPESTAPNRLHAAAQWDYSGDLRAHRAPLQLDGASSFPSQRPSSPVQSLALRLHRAGRVGRIGGAPGVVISLPQNEQDLERLHGFAEGLGFALEEMSDITPAVRSSLIGREFVTDNSLLGEE